MSSLRNLLNTSGFKIGIELVSTRGTITQEKAKKLRHFGEQLCEEEAIDWISITDNAGGHPAISPTTIGRPLLEKGKEIIVHMTCKDYNRNGLESKAWELSSEGFFNILAITGDYPVTGIKGMPKPVFDIDSVGLLYLLKEMNAGLDISKKKQTQLNKTDFFLGAVVSNFKKNENELLPQYLKLLKKIEMGASFIINQVGYDAAKMGELIHFLQYKEMSHIHAIGNVFVLSKFTMNLFHKNRIPGVILTDALFNKCQKATNAADKGKAFFLIMAAKMMAIYKGLGYKGVYFGGIHKIEDFQAIMDIHDTFSANDWQQFVLEFQYAQADEFFMFERDEKTGLTNPTKLNKNLLAKGQKTKHVNLNYKVSKRFYQFLFTEDKGLYNIGKNICSKANNRNNAPSWLFSLERTGKKWLYDCRDCGDCSLSEIAYLCPESQCAKNQRNGPCGGSSNTKCEVKDFDCIWAKAYDRHKYEGDIWQLLEHAPTIQNHQLEGTSSWGNFWLKKDHCRL